MKLSFTTLGCPDWSLERIIDSAVKFGFDAIDFRGLSGEMDIYKLPEFSTQLADTRSRIFAAGLQVSCFSSSVRLFSAENFDSSVQVISEYAKLCEFFGTRYIRVFGGPIGDTKREDAVRVMVEHAGKLGAIAKAHGAKLVLETHDDWTASADVQAVMQQVDPEAVAVLWDVHHPYRMLGETPEDSWKAIGQWVEYTHVKDSLLKDGADFQYCLTGEGDVPLREICGLLLGSGYQGYYTLEWEKKWHPEIEDAEIAFPQYVQYMRNLI